MAKPQKIKNSDGSISWRIRFANADGKRVSRTFATFDLARSELRRLEVQADEDRVRRERLGGGAETVARAGAAFLASYRQRSEDTERRFKKRKAAHESAFRDHIEPHLGDVALCDLTPAVLRKWIEELAAKRTARRGEKNGEGRTLSASRIRAVIVTLRQIAEANNIALVVPLGESFRQKRRTTRPRALQSVEDVHALLASCRDPWFKVAAAIACYCGARLGEVASLRWRHIGSDTVTLEISWEGPLKARYEDDEDDAARVVPLSPELAAILDAWRRVTGGGPDDHVVLVGGKRPLREGHDDMAQKTRSACKRAGIRPLKFHELRASFATLTGDQGLPLTKLQALMGHADATTTAIYLRAESEHAALDPRAILGGRRVDADSDPAPGLLN